MNFTNYKQFYIWWVTVVLIATGTFWLAYSGVIQLIWHTDTTMLTSVIAAIFIQRMALVGYWSYKASDPGWKAENPAPLAKTKSFGLFASEELMALGMLGTVIGLINMLQFAGASDTTTPEHIQLMLSGLYKAMGLALFTNAVGLTSSIILKRTIKYVSN